LLQHFATLLGVAFQIQDDVLNLTAREQDYGKEILGDLWEGKHTLILLHALQHTGDAERERAVAILRKPRTSEPSAEPGRLAPLLDELTRRGELSVAGRHELEAAWHGRAGTEAKTADDVAFLAALVERAGSIPFARAMARRRAERALRTLAAAGPFLRPSVHHDFMRGLATFVVERNW
jgi:geranylgeranyl pyrophosphate synthase